MSSGDDLNQLEVPHWAYNAMEHFISDLTTQNALGYFVAISSVAVAAAVAIAFMSFRQKSVALLFILLGIDGLCVGLLKADHVGWDLNVMTILGICAGAAIILGYGWSELRRR